LAAAVSWTQETLECLAPQTLIRWHTPQPTDLETSRFECFQNTVDTPRLGRDNGANGNLMNQRLLNAVEALEGVLDASNGETMKELMHKLSGSEGFGEAEIPAAVWTLVSDGLAEIENGRVHLIEATVAP
jgi:hypothetical protein